MAVVIYFPRLILTVKPDGDCLRNYGYLQLPDLKPRPDEGGGGGEPHRFFNDSEKRRRAAPPLLHTLSVILSALFLKISFPGHLRSGQQVKSSHPSS